MHRIPNHLYGEAIGEGLARLPAGIRRRLGHVRWVCGIDPLFAGLHHYDLAPDGRTYRNTAHCLYPCHLLGPRSRRMTTIVLPTLQWARPDVVVHELGHALDELTGFHHQAQPVTDYARTNRYEAFAEAFVARTHLYGDRDIAHQDHATVALFDELAHTA